MSTKPQQNFNAMVFSVLTGNRMLPFFRESRCFGKSIEEKSIEGTPFINVWSGYVSDEKEPEVFGRSLSSRYAVPLGDEVEAARPLRGLRSRMQPRGPQVVQVDVEVVAAEEEGLRDAAAAARWRGVTSAWAGGSPAAPQSSTRHRQASRRPFRAA